MYSYYTSHHHRRTEEISLGKEQSCFLCDIRADLGQSDSYDPHCSQVLCMRKVTWNQVGVNLDLD